MKELEVQEGFSKCISKRDECVQVTAVVKVRGLW